MDIATSSSTSREQKLTASAPLIHVLAVVFIALGAVGHWFYLTNNCPLDLSGDEAHYWEWSRNLDISYYSKGPLVAYIIAAGRWAFSDLSHRLVGNDELAVRLPAMALSVATSAGLYVLALLTTRRPLLALVSIALCATMPMLAAGSMLMTIDAPLACAWVWMLVLAHQALREDRWWQWIAIGVLIAVGILAKYNMLLAFPAIGTLMLIRPELRRFALRPGPYIAAFIGAIGFLPIVLWNAQHEWVSLRHVAGQAGVSGGSGFSLMGPLAYVAGQMAVVGPIWFPCLLVAIGLATRRLFRAESNQSESFLLLATATPLLTFLVFSPITKIQPNWPAVSYLTGTVMLATWLAGCLRDSVRSVRVRTLWIIATGVGLGFAGTMLAHHTEVLMPMFRILARSSPPWELTPVGRLDPTARLRGWQELGTAVSEVLAEQRAAGRDPFIASDDYQTASQLAFYVTGNPRTYSFQSALGGRQSQYDIWTNPLRDREQFVGRPVIYIGRTNKLLTGEDGGQAALPGMKQVRLVEHRVAGEKYQIWAIWVCDSFAGFPRDLQTEGKY